MNYVTSLFTKASDLIDIKLPLCKECAHTYIRELEVKKKELEMEYKVLQSQSTIIGTDDHITLEFNNEEQYDELIQQLEV